MRTDKNLLVKGIKYLFFTILLMFSAPFAIYEAFKNQGHPLYWPVLILGVILAITAVAFGFYSIKLMVDAVFGKKK